MVLRLYNTLTRTKEEFHPLDEKNVRMYVCGPTVYDFAHIGNARPVIVFDVLFRLLRHLYGEAHVKYVRNITDVDDRINARALEEKISIRELTERTAKQFHEDVAALGALPPSEEPRATEHVAKMIAMIETLIASDHAYVAEGHVLFDISSKPDYGKLARRSLDEMLAGARVEVAPYKKNPMDFVLWKPSKPGEPSWPSPWSEGRPGWHIECSAMSEALLGETFDIHGGGIDLVFPHHENEVAQSEAAHHGHALAKVWMHNGFLQVEGEKMSKSLGNFVTIRQLLRGWGDSAWTGGAIRLAMLRTHYRQPINWTLDDLSESRNELAGWTGVLNQFRYEARLELESRSPGASPELEEALSDDLNTPEALAVLRALYADAFAGDADAARKLAANLRFLGAFDRQQLGAYSLGVTGGGIGMERLIDAVPFARAFQAATANVDVELVKTATGELAKRNLRAEIERLGVSLKDLTQVDANEESIEQVINRRNAARRAKNFKEADRIRDELAAKGIVLKDGPDGTTWEVKR